MAVGDIVAARMVFQRAAETGDAGAAMALGATYDPLILARLGAVGMVADVSKARSWYEKAKEFGSQEAPRRLEQLRTADRIHNIYQHAALTSRTIPDDKSGSAFIFTNH